jgi:hypothetical protein
MDPSDDILLVFFVLGHDAPLAVELLLAKITGAAGTAHHHRTLSVLRRLRVVVDRRKDGIGGGTQHCATVAFRNHAMAIVHQTIIFSRFLGFRT